MCWTLLCTLLLLLTQSWKLASGVIRFCRRRSVGCTCAYGSSQRGSILVVGWVVGFVHCLDGSDTNALNQSAHGKLGTAHLGGEPTQSIRDCHSITISWWCSQWYYQSGCTWNRTVLIDQLLKCMLRPMHPVDRAKRIMWRMLFVTLARRQWGNHFATL